jgi:hypothetical protein
VRGPREMAWQKRAVFVRVPAPNYLSSERHTHPAPATAPSGPTREALTLLGGSPPTIG